MTRIPKKSRITVILESATGANKYFMYKDKKYTRAQMCDKIAEPKSHANKYYSVVKINSKRTPKTKNGFGPNLG